MQHDDAFSDMLFVNRAVKHVARAREIFRPRHVIRNSEERKERRMSERERERERGGGGKRKKDGVLYIVTDRTGRVRLIDSFQFFHGARTAGCLIQPAY